MKFACVNSGSAKAQTLQAELNQHHDIVSPAEADVILALGGDGLILRAVHQFLDVDKPIYGLNCGTIGFLMNSYGEADLVDRLPDLKLIN